MVSFNRIKNKYSNPCVKKMCDLHIVSPIGFTCLYYSIICINVITFTIESCMQCIIYIISTKRSIACCIQSIIYISGTPWVYSWNPISEVYYLCDERIHISLESAFGKVFYFKKETNKGTLFLFSRKNLTIYKIKHSILKFANNPSIWRKLWGKKIMQLCKNY